MQLSFSFSLIFFLRQSTAHIEWEDVFTVIDPKLVEQWIFVSEHDLMHSRFAGSRGDGVEGELEQRAGEGPLSCDSDDAAPARDIGRTQSRANGSVRTCSSCQEPQEGGRLGTPAATNLLFEMITEAIPTVCRFSSLVSFIIFRK
ncbi:hypothetical protein AK812_SmicGene41374 [Symbiodinium microadriaticum]|uniref:Secreted protein n=1 Tax=Symbiodinium microadriaticum TaxID=2951 RepID=A0A1Q9C6A8_SYMMI|nr:hypothetical protein AK812_SmicGene41374 [Symbiodinium microadriaticum]